MSDYWERMSTWQKTKAIISVVVLVFIVIFSIINWESRQINFVFGRVNVPLTLIIVICLLVGYSLSSFNEYKYYNRKVKEVSDLEARVKELEAALEAEKSKAGLPPTPEYPEDSDWKEPGN